ncbi:titin-like [Odontomachus brunneus]|uniref:titin-like n=1 Tax=Odontomachus brunneus TaxID=486640 RepID=UPI0013F1BF23|nr:titin-like [Odontomachus brunneus]XP_032663646.1 titin-like [Odontomachus brunneus]
MESRKDSVEETLDRAVHQRNTTETEPSRSVIVEPKIPETINARKEKGRVTSAFRRSTTRENKGISKETNASGSYSEVADDAIQRGNKSARESEGDAMVARQVTSADGTWPRRESDGPKRLVQDPRKIGARRRQRPFCDMIGRREQRREELGKMEGDLRQRLDMLECSMPAMMAWNICRMTQGMSACGVRRVLEEHFKTASELPSRGTPSCHYDCRVREVEAERKLALKKLEEARALWTEKIQALGERKRQLEEARKVQEEQRHAMERLNEEIEALREAAEEESCRHGKCSDKRCGPRWLAKVFSVTSIESGDVECLGKLEQLAEEELLIKKDIAELERREDAYMRTLQRADELWSKAEDDAVSAASALQEQLDTKTAANQQLAGRVCELEDALEQYRARMAACRSELEKFLSIEKLEAVIGRDDDVAEVTDRAVAVRPKVTHRPIGRLDDVATVKDDEVLARVEVADDEVLARVEVADEEVLAVIAATDADATAAILLGDDKYVSARPESTDLAVDRQVDLVPVTEEESVVRPEDFDYEQRRFQEVKEYLAQLDSLEELYEDDGEPCPPDFVCNGVVASPTGMTDEELIAMGMEPIAEATEEARKLAANEEQRRRMEAAKITDEIERRARVDTERKVPVADDGPITTPKVRRLDPDQDVVIRRDELLSWIGKIDTIRTKIAKYPELQTVKKEADILAEQIGAYIGVKPKEVVADEAEKRLGEDEIKYVREVPAELPKIDSIEETQVKLPDVITKTTEMDMERAKLEDKSVVPGEEVKPESKIPSTPIPHLIEAPPVEVDLAKEETSAEPPTVVSLETPRVQKTEADDETAKPVNGEKLIAEKAEREEKEMISKRAERTEIMTEPKVKEPSTPFLEETPAERDLKKEIIQVGLTEAISTEPPGVQQIEVDDDMTKLEERLRVEKAKRKKEETIAEHAERIEMQIESEMEEPSTPAARFEDAPTEADLKEEVTAEPFRPVVPSKPIEPPQIQQIEADDDATKPVDEKPLVVQQVERKEEEEEVIPERIEFEIEDLPKEKAIVKEAEEPRVEIIEMEAAAPVETKKKTKPAEEAEPIVADAKEVEELTVDEVSPGVDLVKVEEVKPSELPIVEVEEIEAIKQPVLETEVTKARDEEMERVMPPVAPREEEVEKLPSIKKAELPAEVPMLSELTAKVKREEAVLLEGKFHVFEAFEVEEKILIVKAKPSEAAEISAASIEPQPPVKPHFVLDRRSSKFEERELLYVIAEATKPSPPTSTQVSPVEKPAEEVEITARSGVVEAELITKMRLPTAEGRHAPSAQIISEYFKSAELEANAEIAGDRPEITGRKIPWRKRLKDQSTVTTTNAGLQTDKTSHVSHDRVERERARLTTDELLRSIKIAARLTRGDPEREIRTINYGVRTSDDDDGTATRAACNCCLCGNAASSSSSSPTRPKSQIQSKTTAPLAAAFKRAFIPLKADHVIPYDRLCPDCKAKIQGKMTRDQYRVEQIVGKISHNRENQTSSLATSCHVVPRRRTIEKKDQSCSAKIPKRKGEVAEQKKKKRDTLTAAEQMEKKPLTPSCICFQLEKPSAGPMRKGNCHCAD